MIVKIFHRSKLILKIIITIINHQRGKIFFLKIILIEILMKKVMNKTKKNRFHIAVLKYFYQADIRRTI